MPTQTFKILRETREVPAHVKEGMKAYNKIKREIKKALKEGEKNIKAIAEATGLAPDVVTYNLMTMLKYGDVVAGEIDEDEEYFFYKLK